MNSYTALLYNETNALCLILLLIVLCRIAGNKNIKAKLPSSMGFVISLILLTVGDIFWAFVNGNIIPFTVFNGYTTNLVYFIGTLASVYYLFMLFQDTLGYHGDYIKKSILVGFPFVLAFIFVCLTPITHLVFSYEGTQYHRGNFYAVTLCIPYAFVIYLCIASFVKSFQLKYFIIRKSLRIMTLYSLGTLLLSFFQLISTNVFPLYVVGGALIALMMYIDGINDSNTIDSLTRLPNRRTFENRVSDFMKKGCDADKSIYIVMTDLNDFKPINEIFGRDEGDLVLQETSRILQKLTPTGWVTARFGGDEFAMIGICAPEEIDYICQQITNAFDEHNSTSTKPYTITASVASAELAYNCKNVYDFIKLALRRLDDVRILARTSAKGKNVKSQMIASSNQDAAPITQQDINLWMNDALKNGDFVPYFQPQINVADGKVSGAEALVRWIHPERGIIFPSIFVPVFERNGFIYEMDKAIWHSVCAKVRKWKDAGLSIPTVSVNISRWDIVQSNFMETILSYLEEYKLQPSDLRLEITESAYLFDQDYLIRLMEDLQKLGFEIEMDDFGSGYSSLTAFKDLPFNLVKLDASLIRESTKTDKAAYILKSIVGLAKSLRIPLIAEGVEYKEQADFLQRIGCSDMQGYLFAKPMPEDKFLDFVEQWNAKK